MKENKFLVDPKNSDLRDENEQGWYIVAVVFNDVARDTEVYMEREIATSEPTSEPSSGSIRDTGGRLPLTDQLIATINKLQSEIDMLKKRVESIELH